jgi:hypothetical protein
MARNMKTSWEIIFSAATKKKDTQKKRLPAYALQKKHPNTHPRKISQKR